MRVFPFAMLLTLAAAGCERREQLGAPDSAGVPVAPGQRLAYLSVSDLAPEPGATIVVAGTLGVGEALSLGSFRVRVTYDSTRLRYVDEIAIPGMLRVVNPQASEVIVAGASSEPSSDGRLFAVRFRVDDPAGLNSLSLRIDEMNDANFQNQAQSVTRASRLMLDSALVPRKVNPR